VREDVRAKARAVAHAAREAGPEPDVSRFLAKVQQLASLPLDAAALLLACRHLDEPDARAAPAPEVLARALAGGVGGPRPGRPDKDAADGREALRTLSRELVTYLYYCATMLECFHDGLAGVALEDEVHRRRLDLLAEARRSFALHAGVARGLLTSFRKA